MLASLDCFVALRAPRNDREAEPLGDNGPNLKAAARSEVGPYRSASTRDTPY